ncbi:MAG TPA: hypothetical protein PLS15_00140 [Fimbriimonadaceae bacterium]|nr:hypothetical protein [Fimbriimonadaceae bacterium]HRE94371.1 hypothetical protein [Fimbriimonadaceae bacterium]
MYELGFALALVAVAIIVLVLLYRRFVWEHSEKWDGFIFHSSYPLETSESFDVILKDEGRTYLIHDGALVRGAGLYFDELRERDEHFHAIEFVGDERPPAGELAAECERFWRGESRLIRRLLFVDPDGGPVQVFSPEPGGAIPNFHYKEFFLEACRDVDAPSANDA